MPNMMMTLLVTIACLGGVEPDPRGQSASDPSGSEPVAAEQTAIETPASRPAYLEEPRFVSEEWRAKPAPPPRKPDTVLAELRSLSSPQRPMEDNATDDAWDAFHRDMGSYHAAVADLVAELEELGYNGPDRDELLRRRVTAIAAVAQQARGPINLWTAALWEMQHLHEGTPTGALAELQSLHVAWLSINGSGLTFSEASISRVAELELAAAPALDPEEVGSVLQQFITGIEDDDRARWERWMVEHLPEESRARRSVILRSLEGSPLRLTGLGIRGEDIDTADWAGDVVLVHFWGSWCSPCVANLPTLSSWRDELAPRGLSILGVANEDPDITRAFVAEHGYDWPHLAGNESEGNKPGAHGNAIASRFGITRYPTYWLIDRDGRLHLGRNGNELRQQILELLDQKAE